MLDEFKPYEATYRGREIKWLRGCRVLVTRPLSTEDEDTGETLEPRVEALPWLEREGRYSFVSADPLVADLARVH